MTSVTIDRRAGLSSSAAIKGPCRAATTTNITLSGHQTIDDIAVVTGDRVLVKDQTDARYNGLYVVDTGDWQRCKDFSRNDDVVKGTRVVVTDGTSNAGGTYQVAASSVNFDIEDMTFAFVERISPADITNLTSASTLTGAEQFAVIQSGNSRKSTVSAVWTYIKGLISGSSLATTGVSTLIGVDESGSLVRAARQVFNVIDYGAKGDNSTDDTTAILAARTALLANNGGVLFFPKTAQNTYKCASTIQMSANGFRIAAESKGTIIDFSAQTSGPGIALGGIYDWSIENVAVLNSYGACIEINRGTVTGPQTYCAYGFMKNVVVRGARNAADNLEIGGCYMSSFDTVRSQGGVRKGIAIYGYCTSLTFTSCHAFDAADDNWQVNNISYSTLISCGSDGTGGYGYSLQDADINMVACGCETAAYSAIEIVFDNTSTAIVKGINLVLDGFQTLNNNTGLHAGVGFLATTSGSPASTAAGHIQIRGYRNLGSATGNAVEGAGAFTYAIDQRSQSQITFGAAPGFSWVGDGATDIPATLPVNITGANTRIATLRPKLRNGTAAYGGLLIITVAQNNRSTGSRTATYLVAVNKASAGTAGAITTVSSLGNTAGANAADASFTFSYDSTSDELRATVVGSTTTGNWYFHIGCIGNISAVIG